MANRIPFDPFLPQFASGAERRAKQDVFGPGTGGTAASFVTASMNDWLQNDALANIQNTNALGRVHLVSGYREQVYPKLTDVCGDFAHRLSRIGVEQNPSLTRNLGDLGNGL